MSNNPLGLLGRGPNIRAPRKKIESLSLNAIGTVPGSPVSLAERGRFARLMRNRVCLLLSSFDGPRVKVR